MPVFAGQRSDAAFWNALADWGTYVPELTATTNPNLGSAGEATGFWWRQGRLIRGFALFLFSGTGVNEGSGQYLVSVPFPADADFNSFSSTGGQATVVGSGKLRDNSTTANSRNTVSQLTSSTELTLRINGSNSNVSSGLPFTWAAGDRISINFTYLADVSALPDPPENQRGWRNGGLLPGPQSWGLDRVRPYTPRLVAATTNPNLGENGEAVGWWRLNNYFVIGEARFLFSGDGLDPGSGTSYRVTLPVTSDQGVHPDINVIGGNPVYGWGFARDNSVEGNSMTFVAEHIAGVISGVNPHDSLAMTPDNTSTNAIGPTDFFTWAANDRLAIKFMYPADPEIIRRDYT